MKQYTLDPKALLGGIIAQDNDQEIVQLSLQKNNEIPTYETDAIILLLVLNGSAQIVSTQGTLETKGLQGSPVGAERGTQYPCIGRRD